jgi:uncharacterized protein (DUF1015 family)
MARIPTGPESAARPSLELAPFRGLRYDDQVVPELGSVVSPPYDVLDADTVRDLEAGNRRNIVRLILSRRHERPYTAVRERLERWRREGCLVPDDTPALYLYQYSADGRTVRGLIGLIGLRDEADGVVLPHEDVMPGPVADRAALMRTTQTNLEPILLVHEGTSAYREVLADTAAREAPAARFRAADRSDHTLWLLSDPGTLALLRKELATGTALIADGHHRYAAYRRLQHEMRSAGVALGESPWDYGLAMLVDQHDHPLEVGPIHRSVAALTMADVVELAVARGDEVRTARDRETAFSLLGSDPDRTEFVLSDGRAWAVLNTVRSSAIDAAVLHEQLLPAWNVTEEQVGYHHSLDQALQTVSRQPGVVVAVRPPGLGDVMSAAARGRRMPRKSTSFGPKPRMGVVMRDLRDA